MKFASLSGGSHWPRPGRSAVVRVFLARSASWPRVSHGDEQGTLSPPAEDSIPRRALSCLTEGEFRRRSLAAQTAGAIAAAAFAIRCPGRLWRG